MPVLPPLFPDNEQDSGSEILEPGSGSESDSRYKPLWQPERTNNDVVFELIMGDVIDPDTGINYVGTKLGQLIVKEGEKTHIPFTQNTEITLKNKKISAKGKGPDHVAIDAGQYTITLKIPYGQTWTVLLIMGDNQVYEYLGLFADIGSDSFYNTPIAGFNFTLSNHIDQRGIVSLKDNRIVLTDHQPNNNFVIGGQKYSDNVSKRYLDIPDNVAKLLFKDEEPG